VIYGCAGPSLTDREKAFFAKIDPLGFILFSRNIESPDQVRALVRSLREAVGREAPVLIDQEGGRVQRLRPPHWRVRPPMVTFGKLAAGDLPLARRAARLNAHLIAAELRSLGIDVDCAPLIDVPVEGADMIIGDRAFGADPMLVADLGRAVMDGLLDGGVMPIVKHIPGHGRAMVDSHKALPIVDADAALLQETDFAPFRALADMPWAMTAHVVFAEIDDRQPATTSAAVIDAIVRGSIGFDGVLVSDDIGMGALAGTIGERVTAALAAGCDLAMHCNGTLDEMREAAEAAALMTAQAMARVARGEKLRREARREFDRRDAEARFDALLGAAVR